jgi:type II secretory pathway pseudopilin PulG
MHGSQKVALQHQRGVSLSGLIFVLAILGLLAIFAMKLIPSLLEYKSAKDAIKSAKATNGTPQEMRKTFSRNADMNDVLAVTGQDLIITKDGGQTEIAFAYSKDIPLFTNVKLVIDFEATTNPNGDIPEKTEAPQ